MSLDGLQPNLGMRCDVCGSETKLIGFRSTGDARYCPEQWRDPELHRNLAYEAAGETPPDRWQEFLIELQRRAAEKAWDEAIASVKVTNHAGLTSAGLQVRVADNPYREET